MNRRTSREEYTLQNKSLTKTEEEVLIREILKLDSQGLSLTINVVKEIADSITQARGRACIAVNWTYRFIQRIPALSMKLGRTYECQRKLCEDLGVIQD